VPFSSEQGKIEVWEAPNARILTTFVRSKVDWRLLLMLMPYSGSSAFTTIAPYYDMLMRDVPYQSWVRYVQRLLEARRVCPRRVLDLACGTGNVAEILATLGYEVVGVDISAPMIAEARRKTAQRGLSIIYHVQDAAELNLSGPPFDLCLSLFDSLNYIIEPVRLFRAIQRVHQHLHQNGWFIFDINSVFALEKHLFDQENLDANARLRYIWRSEYDPQTRLCHIHMRFILHEDKEGIDHEFRETHVQFAYREEEIREMLEQAGFDQIETYHAYTLKPVHPTTDRIFFIARRPH
jgi:ubiquinone/menaquinone biosynthesis C-methylase UbiE